jgi:dTDP-4-amino-4,6-dideoxygalactose transaminase
MQVPFFTPEVGEEEIAEVVATLRSGWLTSGPRVRRLEETFAAAVGASFAVAVNSGTAALHLAVEALGLKPGEAVLVPTMTFAATAEVVRYFQGLPVLIDCDPFSTNIDLNDAEHRVQQLRSKKLPPAFSNITRLVGMIPVHVGGMMMNIDSLNDFSSKFGLWMIEDAAHAFPSAWRRSADQAWQFCGNHTANVTCYSFYANKTMTTGEGGIAVTDDQDLAERMRLMSLHGLSHDSWMRYANTGNWDYKIIAPGFKYNMTDVAAAMGIHQLQRAEQMRQKREQVARFFLDSLKDIEEIELPPEDPDRLHSWHLFPIKLRLNRLTIDRDAFLMELKQAGVGCSVHWRPLHLHPYYEATFGWKPEDFPVATAVWKRLISLPIFSAMTDEQTEFVAGTLRSLCARYAGKSNG